MDESLQKVGGLSFPNIFNNLFQFDNFEKFLMKNTKNTKIQRYVFDKLKNY